MKVSEKTIWTIIVLIWITVAAIFFYNQREKRVSIINYISLPEEISLAKTGDSLIVSQRNDTVIIGFYHKGIKYDKQSTILVLK